MQFIISGVANIKAAANHMLKQKIESGLVTVTNKDRTELEYAEIFSRKTVTQSDLDYYKSRLSVADILGHIDADIKAAPAFEWFPKYVLTSEQIKSLEKKMVDEVDQATAVYKLCQSALARKKETESREVVERVTNQRLLTKENQQLEKETKAALKAVDKAERKATSEAEKAERKATLEAEKADNAKRFSKTFYYFLI